MRKRLQEERSCTASSRLTTSLAPRIVTSARGEGNLKQETRILEVCVGRVDLGTKVFIKWHAPEPVVLCLACYVELVPKGVIGLEALFVSIYVSFLCRRD